MAKTVQKRSASPVKAAKKSIKKASPKSSASSKKSTGLKNSYTKTITMFKGQADYFQLNQKYEKKGIATRLIHAGNEPSQEFHGVVPPIDMSTTYSQPAPGVPVVFDYARCGNPTRSNLERTLASIEHGKYAFATSSGMAAHVTLMQLLQPGDHVLCVDDVYGGTQRYLRKILTENSHIDMSLACFLDIKAFKKEIRPNTKIVWLETPTNPTLKIYDIRKIADALKGTGILLVVDNTFFTPVNQNPLDLGADVVTHSITKYIGGHSDVIAGCMVMNDKDLYDRLFFILKTMGTGLSAFDSWIALRGAKTLEVRVQRAGSNAMAVAKLLEAHPKVDKVIYPGLKSHPQHHIAKKQARGFGGMLSFYIKGNIKTAERFLKALRVITLAESLGGVESLAENPAIMTHGSVPAEHRRKLGIEDNFIRISVGIETEADLLADVNQALSKA